MKKMTIRIVEKSLELAMVKAAGQLGITQDDLVYRVVSESTGFLGLFGKKVSIDAWKRGENPDAKAPARQQKAHQRSRRIADDEGSDPAIEKRVLLDSEVAALVAELQLFCEGICSHLTQETVSVETLNEGGRLVLNIKNDYLAGQIAKNTKLAEALEHILRKKPRHLRQELPFRIFVDCNDVRCSREKELVEMALDLSLKVSENKKPVVLNYRSSYDRKIIHMALDKDDRVFTKSIGSGPNRKLMILPSSQDGSEIPTT
jgi:spoIIIJ-associated protein